jgi:integrase
VICFKLGEMTMNPALRIVSPRNDFRSVAPGRAPNAELRSREYLTPAEIERLMKVAREGRHGQRDASLILIAYRHGLRATEICDLEWSQVELTRSATLHVRRVKNGKPATHTLRGDEVRALRELQRKTKGGFVFETERGGPFTPDAVNRLVKRIGERAGFAFPEVNRVDSGHKIDESGGGPAGRGQGGSASGLLPLPAQLVNLKRRSPHHRSSRRSQAAIKALY